MLPLPLIVALVLGFGLRGEMAGGPWTREATLRATASTTLVVAGVVLAALVLGRLLGRRLRSSRRTLPQQRLQVLRLSAVLSVANLGAFAWVLAGLGWARAVDQGMGLARGVLVDELLILLPYLAGQVGVWTGMLGPERLLHRRIHAPVVERSAGAQLVLKARAALGLVLPGLGLYVLGTDLVGRYWPRLAAEPLATLASMVVLGMAMVHLAPAFVRMAWPTRSLEAGPLRERLEAMAEKLGFRYTDILVWETDHAFANAGITGSLPWFRYVLLTDALVDRLEPPQVEAVFGHEVGHVAHRHLSFFAFFFIGSMGVLALLGQGFDWALREWGPGPSAGWMVPSVVEGTALVLCLGLLGLYVFAVFGFVSRRFERQADVYGCRAVSCTSQACPPHGEPGQQGVATAVCPGGIRTFATALASVAILNGMDVGARSWRHGSIDRRIRFLLSLEGQPQAERRFQGRVRLLRLALATALIAGLVGAAATGALEHL